eukprot:g12662.t1
MGHAAEIQGGNSKSNQNIIAATPAWLEATGLTWNDIKAANASGGSGIRRAVANWDPRGRGDPAETAGGGGVGQRAPPPELLKFLDKPDDILVPQKVTQSSLTDLGLRPGLVLFQNLAAALPQKTIEFSDQWHEKGGYTYTGFTAVSRMFFHKKDGTDVAAYLLNLRKTERAYPVPGTPIVWLCRVT